MSKGRTKNQKKKLQDLAKKFKKASPGQMRALMDELDKVLDMPSELEEENPELAEIYERNRREGSES